MIRNRSELDACLFKEWQAKKDKSFIYGYTRDRMDESARALAEKIGEGGNADDANSGKNRYIRLKAIDIAFNDINVISYKQYEEMLIAYREDCGEKAKGKFRDFNDRNSIRKNVDSLLDYFLRNTVYEYFKSQGYSVKKEKDTSTDTTVERVEIRTKQRTYIDPIELYLAYSENAGISGKAVDVKHGASVASGDILSRLGDDNYFMECLKLVESCNRQKKIGTYLPLYVDDRTGAGIYLIGKNFIKKGEKLSQSCYPCIVALKEAFNEAYAVDILNRNAEDEIGEWLDPDAEVDVSSILSPEKNMHPGYHYLLAEKIVVRYDRLSEARTVFSRMLKDNRVYNVYRYYNDLSDEVSDIPESFRDYMYIPEGSEGISEDEVESIRSVREKEDEYIEKENRRKIRNINLTLHLSD